MAKLLAALLCLMLCGCAQHVPPAKTLPPEMELTEQALQTKQALETRYHLDAYPLSQRKVRELRETKEGILLLSGYGSTTLTMLNSGLSLSAELTLDFEALVSCFDQGICCFNPENRELLLLDFSLQETERISLPAEQTGQPLLSADAAKIYYSTPSGIYAWDLESGIRQRIKEISAPLELVGLHCGDTVLQCRTETSDLFLDGETGKLLKETGTAVTLKTLNRNYYAAFSLGFVPSLVFSGDRPMTLIPEDPDAQGYFLPDLDAAVTVSEAQEGSLSLKLYKLTSGTKCDTLILDSLHRPKALASYRNGVLLLVYDPETDCDILLHWPMPEPSPSHSVHTEPYYAANSPDTQGLAQCQEQAQSLGALYGIEILTGKAAAAAEPWDYAFEAEYRTSVIARQLETLENCLSRYPRQLLQDTAADFGSLRICLVQQIRGSSQTNALETATGIQFLQECQAYVVIAAGKYAEQALYHELFHVMETHILSGSTALDRWDTLNPAGFSYDLDYSANHQRNSGVYLENGQRAFVDTYSMSYPKEDRARIFEYAMLPGMEAMFTSQTMQHKLQAICTGIREAYDLEAWEDPLPWEQYLQP